MLQLHSTPNVEEQGQGRQEPQARKEAGRSGAWRLVRHRLQPLNVQRVQEKRELEFKDEDQEYAQVTKVGDRAALRRRRAFFRTSRRVLGHCVGGTMAACCRRWRVVSNTLHWLTQSLTIVRRREGVLYCFAWLAARASAVSILSGICAHRCDCAVCGVPRATRTHARVTRRCWATDASRPRASTVACVCATFAASFANGNRDMRVMLRVRG